MEANSQLDLKFCRACMAKETLVPLFEQEEALKVINKVCKIDISQDKNKLEAHICINCNLKFTDIAFFGETVSVIDKLRVSKYRTALSRKNESYGEQEFWVQDQDQDDSEPEEATMPEFKFAGSGIDFSSVGNMTDMTFEIKDFKPSQVSTAQRPAKFSSCMPAAAKVFLRPSGILRKANNGLSLSKQFDDEENFDESTIDEGSFVFYG